MKRLHVIRVELPKQQNEIEVHVIADVHLSDPNCDIRGVQKRVADIAERDNAYVILAGDLIDNATRSSIGDIYSTQLSPMEQIQLANKTFAPLKGRILCAVPGNHEERTYRADGIDITWLIANELGAGNRYAPDAALVFVSLGENSRRKSEGRQTTYSIYVNHGNGGGRKIGGKINRLADYAQIVDADVYVCGHTHSPAVFKDCFFRTNASTRSAEPVERLFVNTAAALDYGGGYGVRMGYQPASKVAKGALDGRAEEIARERTFQNEGKLSGVMGGMRNALNKLSIKDKQGGSIGLGDIMLPFTNVPGNIASAAIQYSPAGFINAGTEVVKVLNKAKAGTLTASEQAKAVTDFGRAFNGTMGIALFAVLAGAGVMNVAGDDDEDEEALEKSEGVSGTQLNLSALNRWIAGESTEWRDGDDLVSIGFLDPINAQMTYVEIHGHDA